MGRKSRKIALIKDGKIIKIGSAKDVATHVGMSYTGIFQYIRENRTTKQGLSFKYADECEDIQIENNLKQLQNDDLELEFYIPNSKEECRKMLLQFIEKNFSKRWRNAPYNVEKAERKFMRQLLERI